MVQILVVGIDIGMFMYETMKPLYDSSVVRILVIRFNI